MLNATPVRNRMSFTTHGAVIEPRREPVDRTFHGLLATGLLEDLRAGAPHTLIAPTNAAFDELPWAFEDLVFDPELVEVRFDLFEYLVVPGDFDEGERATLGGEPVRIEGGVVFGRYGSAAILRSFVTGNLRVHVVDSCVLPGDPQNYVDAASEVCDAQLC